MKKYIGSVTRTFLAAMCGLVLGLYVSDKDYTIHEICSIFCLIAVQVWSLRQKFKS